MEPERAPLTLENLGPGDHLCSIFEMEAEHRAVLTPFLRQGLERGERVLYVADDRSRRSVLDYLRDDGLRVAPYVASGQLTILTSSDAYTRGGVFDPEAMIGLLSSEADRTLAKGYRALRITGEMTWALHGLPGSERLIEYEARLNEFFPGSNCLAICQYDRRRFAPDVLLNVLRTHPVAVVGTELFDNFYYVPPAELLDRERPEMELQRWLRNLDERRRAETGQRRALAEALQATQALRASEERYRIISELVSDHVYSLQVTPGTQGDQLTREWAAGPFTHVTGYTAEEIDARGGWISIVHPDDVDAFERRVDTLLDGRPSVDEYRVVAKGGEVHWVLDYARPAQDKSDGRVVRVLGAAQDITERKRAEEASRQSLEETARNQRLLLALSQAAQAVQRARTPEEVYQTLGAEVSKLGYNAAVFTLSQDKRQLALAHVTLDPALVRAAEKLTGLSLAGFILPVTPGGFYEQVLDQTGTTYAGLPAKHIGEALPGPVRPLASRLAGIVGLERAIYAPLTVSGQTCGLLAVLGAGLAEADVAAVTVFANQAAIAIENARLFEEVVAGQERAKALSRQLVAVQEAERRHIARELHDEIGQVLTGLNLLLGISTDAPVSAVEERLGEARALVEELMTTVDELSLDLRPAMLDDLGLLPALLWHVDRYSSQTGVSVSLEHAGLERRFSAELETAAYRIVQEALTNVARHARVDEVAVRLWADGESLVVQVEDRGTGFSPHDALAAGASGLSGMRERVSLLGGELTVDSYPGGGTCLTAEWPSYDGSGGAVL